MSLREILTRALRRKGRLAFGPLALVGERRLADLEARLARAERELARAGVLTTGAAAPRRDRRSVAFLHNAYYNFYYLAAALRRRGWDAVSVSVEDPAGPHAKFYHGEDLNLFDPDPARLQARLDAFFEEALERFSMIHFYGRGHMSLFPDHFDRTPAFDALPLDFLRLKQAGVKIGYSVCGCLDGVAQSSVNAWSGGACDRCVWQHERRICGDRGNLAWGHKVEMVCDLIATEGFPALDWQSSAKAFREPLTTALDREFWRPDLEVPEALRLPRTPGELIVYHGVGNFDMRARDGRDVKGTSAVVAAVDRLRREDVNVRLEFVTGRPNTEVRFFMVQADIVVDQLNYGRYGAQAREGMMLGRPTVCWINRDEPPGAERLQSIETCPLVAANEETVYAVLKDLLGDPEKRRRIGEASREFAVAWHSADACAERFERVYDRLMAGERPVELPPAAQ